MRTILAASDPLDANEQGLRAAAILATRTGASVHALRGAGVVGLPLREALPRLEPAATARLRASLEERARTACADLRTGAPTCHVSYRGTLESLPAAARALNADLVVVGPGLVEPGAAATRAAGRLATPLLVARQGAPPPFRSVLVPLSPSDIEAGTLPRACGWLAAIHGAGHGSRFPTEIHVLHVVEGLRDWPETAAALGRALREAGVALGGAGRLHLLVRWARSPAERILEAERDVGADLIVLTSTGIPNDTAETATRVAALAGASLLVLPAAAPARGVEPVRPAARPADLEPVLTG